MIRAVLDTNTIISGMFWTGTPRQVYVAGFNEKFLILTSDSLFTELDNVLRREKFAPGLVALGKSADDLLAELHRAAEFVDPVEVPSNVVRDPKDQAVLACAIGGKADFIISGDKDLLVLNAYENIPILSADQFLLHLSSE